VLHLTQHSEYRGEPRQPFCLLSKQSAHPTYSPPIQAKRTLKCPTLSVEVAVAVDRELPMEEHALKGLCPSLSLHRRLLAHRLRRLETSCGGVKRGKPKPKLMHVRNKKPNVPQLLALLLSSNHSNLLLPLRPPVTAAQVAVLLQGHLKMAPLIRPTLGPFNHKLNHPRPEDR